MGWDWDAVMREEGSQLNRIIADWVGRPGPFSLLDCSCGIGTQAVGLALQGHRVHATDLSEVSIECAAREATELGLEIKFGVADFRNIGDTVTDTFDVVLSCDNSIAHCLQADDLSAALSSMKQRLNPGGLLLLSMRDYDALIEDQPRFNNQRVQDREDGRRVVFQLWDWADDGRRYKVHQFLIHKEDGEFKTNHFETNLRALLRDEVIAAIRAAGYREVRWHVPEETGYYQPIVTARNH